MIYGHLEKREQKEIKNVIMYTRVSTRDQVLGFSLDKQRLDIKQYCKQNNYNICKEFTDEGKSGKRKESRQGYLQLIDYCQTNKIDALIIWKLSRISRKVRDLLELLDILKENNIALISIQDGLNTANGTLNAEIMLMVLGMVAQMEGDNIVVQAAAGMVMRAEQGKFMGGQIPFGYQLAPESKHGLVIDAEQALIIKKIFLDFAIKQKSLKDILGELKILDVKNQNGKHITKSTLTYLLKNKIYTGTYAWNKINEDEKTIINIIPEWKIVEDDIFNKAQDRLKTQAHTTPRQEGKFLLSGLITCPICNKKLTGDSGTSKTKKVYDYYSCKNTKLHKRYTISKQKAEDIVLTEVGKALIEGDFAKKIKDFNYADEIEQLKKDIIIIKKNITQVEQKITKAIDMRLENEITDENFNTFISEKNKFKEEQLELLTKKEDELKNSENTNKVIEDIENILLNFNSIFNKSKLETEEKNRLIKLIVKNIDLFVSDDYKLKKIKEIELNFTEKIVRLQDSWQGV